MNISLLYNVFMGETSPLIAARMDSPAHEMGARRMENFIPMMAGGIRKRPGTWHDGGTKDNMRARLIDWLLSDGTCVILELTAGFIRVWREYQVTQEIPGEYPEEHLENLQYAASANALWIVHQDHPPMKLEWNGETVEESFPEFTGRDFKAENDRPGAVAFDAGRLCFARTKNEPNRIYMSRSPDSQTGEARHTDFTPSTTYLVPKQDALKAKLELLSVKFKTIAAGNDAITAGLERILADLENNPNNGSNNNGSARAVPIKKAAANLKIMAANMEAHAARLKAITDELRETDELAAAADELAGKAERMGGIISTLRGSAESLLGIASLLEGPPLDPDDIDSAKQIYYGMIGIQHTIEYIMGEVAIFGEEYEIAIAKTESVILGLPKDIDMEETQTVLASDAIVLEENDMHGSRIQWIAANRHFLAATERAVWKDTGDIPTPATFDMNIIEYAGSCGLQAKGAKEVTVYAGRGGRTLRALAWNESAQGGGYIDMDISERAAHLFSAGIKDFAVMDYPYPIVWIVTNAGEIISCTINVRGGILAFARHSTEGKAEAVAVAPQKTGDVVFFVVSRGGARNIEHLILEDLVNEDYAESHYVDAGERKTYNAPTKAITGLQRFAGKTVRVFADGAIEPPVKVNDKGEAELQTTARTVHLGLPYKAAFSPNERQIPANGTSMGKKRRIEKITLRMYKSLGGRAGTGEKKTYALITQKFGGYELGSAPDPFTGDIEVTASGNIDTEGKLVITHDEPAPFTMLALVERVAILEA